MKKLISITFLLCFFLSTRAQTPTIEKLNKQIENNLRSNPDSAKIYMLRLLKYSSELSDTTVGNTYSNIGIQYNKLAVPDSAEFYMKKGIQYTEKYPLVHARMYLNLAINYRMGSRYQESLKALDSAMRFYKKANNSAGEGIAYGEMGSNYNYMLDSEKALENLKKAVAILSKAGNERELAIVKQKLANLYYNNSDFAFARDLYEEVLPVFAKAKGNNYYYTLLSYADCLVQLEDDYQSAEQALKEAIKGLKDIKNQEIMWVSMAKLAQVYSATGRENKAQQELQEAYEGSLSLNSPRSMEISTQYLEFLNDHNKYDIALNVIANVKANGEVPRLKMNAENEISFLKQAVATYGQKGLLKNSLQSFKRMDFLKDSLNDAINQSKSLELQEAYQNNLQRERNIVLTKNNELLEENNSKKDKILLLGILSLILIVVIGWVIFRSNRHKIKLQQELVASLEISKKVLEEKNTLEGELHMERERAFINKEKELVEVSLEMSDLQNKLIEVIEKREKPESSQILAEELKSLLRQNNYWKYFKGKFVEVQPDFASNLSEMFPNLSDSEIAFCCMLNLKLSTSEISSIMGINKEQVASKKNNLSRKIGLEEDVIGFEKFIENLV